MEPTVAETASIVWSIHPAFRKERFESGFFTRQVDVLNPFDPTIFERGEELLALVAMDVRAQVKFIEKSHPC